MEPETRVGALAWDERERAWRLPCTCGGREHVTFARRVVLATGIDGSGQWSRPGDGPRRPAARLYAHTQWSIDFAALKGKCVGVLGAGASSFDNASTALEHGAREVHLFFRRPDLVHVNPYRWAEFVGFLRHFGDLDRRRQMAIHPPDHPDGPATPERHVPTRHPARRVSPAPGFDWKAVEARGDSVRVTTERATFDCDYVIIGTGFVTDLRLRPELALLEKNIARWADRFTPPEEDRHDDLLRHPYLGPSFEFTEREQGSAPYLRYLYNYTFGSLLSLGFGGASISGIKYSIPRLVSGITGSFFIEDRDQYFESLRSFSEVEF